MGSYACQLKAGPGTDGLRTGSRVADRLVAWVSFLPVVGLCRAVDSRSGRHARPRVGVVLETPAWDLTVFKVHFGLLTLKGYTKGARVLRFEAITHNTRQLGGASPRGSSAPVSTSM